ncbi:MAG: YdcF family protein [Paludibacter sp.]|nr:YdcF family protein [Paludibacter sp.]MDD4428548.1 YdcF family protein [Paludibacter sp.]
MAGDVIYLSKILPFFVMPLGLSSVMVLAGILIRRRALCMSGILVLWVAAMPVTSNPFIRMIEGNAVRMTAGDMPVADAIVVLSGGRVTAPGDPPKSEWTDADRFFGGIELFHAGKALVLIFTDGWSPWQPDMPSQGWAMQQHAQDMGVPSECLRVTDKVMNTAAEAVAVARMLPESAMVLLVTSAFHMARAKMEFEQAGLGVVPYPVDFQVSHGKKMSVMDFLPQAGGLRNTERGIKEILGRIMQSHGVGPS